MEAAPDVETGTDPGDIKSYGEVTTPVENSPNDITGEEQVDE